MRKAEGDLDGLLKEWDDVSRWADMAGVEPVYDRAVESARHAMATAVAEAQAAVESEEVVRNQITRFAREAELQRDLVQAQVCVPTLPPARPLLLSSECFLVALTSHA
jgi:hypothetical protein